MEDPYKWIEQLNHVTDANGWEGMKIITQGVNYLKGAVRRWYQKVKEDPRAFTHFESEEEIIEFNRNNHRSFATTFIKKFASRNNKNTWALQYNSLTQENRSIEEYINKFNRLLRLIDPTESMSEEMVIRKLLSEANP